MKRSQIESAVLQVTDVHWGKETDSFDVKVCSRRLAAIKEKLGRVRELLAGYDFDKLVILITGDVNDGTEIFAGQATEQAESDVEEQANCAAAALADLARGQKRIWGNVEIEAVPGNHGRSGRGGHIAANWDVTCYRYMSFRLAADKIPVGFKDERGLFVRNIVIRNHNYLIYHGHEIRTYASIPWYGMMLRVSRWLSTKYAPIDVAMIGHFHSFGMWRVNRVMLMTSGTMVTDDDWALTGLGWESANKWHLFGVSNKHPVTWDFGIDLV
jgi:hypothetical protein